MRDAFKLRAGLSVVGIAFALAGCGGGGQDGELAGPTVTNPQITTAPSPLTNAGGTATVQVDITGAGLDVSAAGQPSIDVKDASARSLLGGAKPMNSLSSQQNRWAYTFALPSNAGGSAAKVYTVTVNARDVKGETGNTPSAVGTVTVPR